MELETVAHEATTAPRRASNDRVQTTSGNEQGNDPYRCAKRLTEAATTFDENSMVQKEKFDSGDRLVRRSRGCKVRNKRWF
jgi:hypothetical protein